MQSSESNQIAAEFFAQGYRVSGTFAITTRLLADVMIDPTTDYLLVQEAYLSPISDSASISAHYTLAMVRKDNLDFVITIRQQDGLRRDQRYGMANNKYIIFLTVPFFEITGELNTTMKQFNPRTYIGMEAGAFITLLNVTARSTFNPNISYAGGVAIINRSKISFFGEKAG